VAVDGDRLRNRKAIELRGGEFSNDPILAGREVYVVDRSRQVDDGRKRGVAAKVLRGGNSEVRHRDFPMVEWSATCVSSMVGAIPPSLDGFAVGERVMVLIRGG